MIVITEPCIIVGTDLSPDSEILKIINIKYFIFLCNLVKKYTKNITIY